jgi:hypothetical protein
MINRKKSKWFIEIRVDYKKSSKDIIVINNKYILDYDSQQRLLYSGKPCCFTDKRYNNYDGHFVGEVHLKSKKTAQKAWDKLEKLVNLTDIPLLARIYKKGWKGNPKMTMGWDNIELSTNNTCDFIPKFNLDFADYSNYKDEWTKNMIDTLVENGYYLSSFSSNVDFGNTKEGKQIRGEEAFLYGHGKMIYVTSKPVYQNAYNHKISCEYYGWLNKTRDNIPFPIDMPAKKIVEELKKSREELVDLYGEDWMKV